ncbi:sensor histidine kinase [Leptodesmis sp.]|uniref:sensor histidine kinase n=1 Tax=Leptodesmis sp. TaxID=3100501 RepID=UPI0040534CB8
MIEAALIESEEKFRRLVESANDLIYMIGLDGNFTYLSPQFHEMWGYELADFEGKSFAEIVHPEDMAKVTRSAQWLMQTRQRDAGLEFRTQRKDGSWCWIVCNSSPIVDANGNVVGLQGIARDVSERKQAELQLQQSEAKLRQQAEELTTTLQKLQTTQLQLIQSEKMSSLGRLVAGVPHEINNPVNFIHGNVIHASEYVQDLLKNCLLKLLKLYYEHYPHPDTAIQTVIEEIDLDFLMQDLPKVLAFMKVGADRIRQIVLSLRTFSRIDEAELKQVDIHDGIDSTLIILEHRLKAKDDHPAIQVIRNYSPLPLIECFAGELNQVFMNILTNAIDALNEVRFTAPADFIPTITLTTRQTESNQITIQIADNGPGIPESIKTRLFDPFFTTKPVGKGIRQIKDLCPGQSRAHTMPMHRQGKSTCQCRLLLMRLKQLAIGVDLG